MNPAGRRDGSIQVITISVVTLSINTIATAILFSFLDLLDGSRLSAQGRQQHPLPGFPRLADICLQIRCELGPTPDDVPFVRGFQFHEALRPQQAGFRQMALKEPELAGRTRLHSKRFTKAAQQGRFLKDSCWIAVGVKRR